MKNALTWGKGYRTIALGVLLALTGALEWVQGQEALPRGALMFVGAVVIGLRVLTTGPVFQSEGES